VLEHSCDNKDIPNGTLRRESASAGLRSAEALWTLAEKGRDWAKVHGALAGPGAGDVRPAPQ